MKLAAAILLVGFALGGCATGVGTIPSQHSLDASGESVVVGRVEMVQRDGQPLTPAPALLVGRMSLTAEHETSQKTYVIECDTRGFLSDFYVSLPAGRYGSPAGNHRISVGSSRRCSAWRPVRWSMSARCGSRRQASISYE